MKSAARMDAIKPDIVAEVGNPERVTGEAPEVTALVTRAKHGDADAFAGLMRLYDRRVIAIGVQMGLSHDDALDACQDAFVKVFRYIRRFRSGQTFYKWLYRIAINAVYDHLSRCRRVGFVSLEEVDPVDATIMWGGRSPESQVESADLARKLLAGLECLSRQERIVFVLRDLQELSTDEIGRMLRISQVTIRRHSMSARHKLRDRLFPKKT